MELYLVLLEEIHLLLELLGAYKGFISEVKSWILVLWNRYILEGGKCDKGWLLDLESSKMKNPINKTALGSILGANELIELVNIPHQIV